MGRDARQERLGGEAWACYCDALREAGEHLLAQNPHASAEVRAAGFDYLLGLVKAGLGQAQDLTDPDRPRFFRNPDSTSRWGAENADNQYLWARVRPDAVYRITGERGTSFDFLVEVKEGYMQLGDARNFATLTAGDLACDDGGRFELWLSAARRDGNWLPLHPDARYVAIRQYFCDWEGERPARFAIECVEAGAMRAVSAVDDTAARLRAAGDWTLGTARFWSEWTTRVRDAWVPGQVAPARKYAGGADDIFYGNDYYRLGSDEAWIVETDPPDARYWQFQLCDAWFRSADWARRPTSLNHAQAHLDADGRFRCVVSAVDPGVRNWLDTGGAPEGILQYRWIWTRDNPQPTVRSVPAGEVIDHLPDGTPRVGPEQRASDLALRLRHRARREPAS